MGRKRRGSGKKVRVDFRRNRSARTRKQNLTHDLLAEPDRAADDDQSERVVARGDLSRRRTVVGADADGDRILRAVDADSCRTGRVTSFIGLTCQVEDEETSRTYECSVRGVLRSMARQARNSVVTGDRVLFRQEGDDYQGVIERVEPRRGVLSRSSQGREHILVANIDQLLIVVSAAQPELKPNLIDRYLISAEARGLQPLIVINKADLVPSGTLQSTVDRYSLLGYHILLTSCVTDRGLPQLRAALAGRQTAVSGQSGVGKSSLLNRADRALHLETSEVSEANTKGRHTTRRARLVRLNAGGWVVDTPGIRQMELWGIAPEETEAWFREFRPFVSYCRFPDCSHLHEQGCGVRAATDLGLISGERYQSYVRLREEDTYLWSNPARGQPGNR